MPDYDFNNLSPIDFEILSRDLLQVELKVRLESFKVGRDLGIDFRYCSTDDQKVIVQCKHYAESGYKILLAKLKAEEIEKVKKLKPQRYIFVTSVGLNPMHKKEIFNIFKPYIKSETDILGRDDLNNLLSLHPEIEKKNFKLWLTSIHIFEDILNKKAINVSRESLVKIREHAKFYVQNESFDEAKSILEEYNACIIAGIPGIGKTTLAEMLVLHYIESGYELVRIVNDISEASSSDYHNVKRIFYYDDFLGQTSLAEKLNKNEDQSLLDFFHAIERSGVSKLILTTREYILNQAKLTHEKLSRAKFDVETCVVDLRKYTRMNRAKILFNHIYFSDIPFEYKSNILEGNGCLKIIDHNNYSPRIIGLLTQHSRVYDINPNEYLNYFISNLDNPLEIWRHAFEGQITQSSRDLLVVLYCLTSEVFIEDLEKSFNAYHSYQCKKYNISLNQSDFRNSLIEVEGNFISIDKSCEDNIVKFHNPSVRDFINNYLSENLIIIESVIESAVYFDQLLSLWKYGENTESSAKFRNLILANKEDTISAIRRTITNEDCRLINISRKNRETYKQRWNRSFESKARILCELLAAIDTNEGDALFHEIEAEIEERVTAKTADRGDLASYLLKAKSTKYINEIQPEKLNEAVTFLSSNIDWMFDFDAFVKLYEGWPEVIADGLYENVQKNLEDYVENINYDTDPDNVRDDAYRLNALGLSLSVDVSPTVRNLEEYASNLEIKAEETEELSTTNDHDSLSDHCNDDDILSMFSQLNQR